MNKAAILLGAYLTEFIYLLSLIGLLVCSVGFYVSVDHDVDSIRQIATEW